jgi:signal transduction histidine kinase
MLICSPVVCQINQDSIQASLKTMKSNEQIETLNSLAKTFKDEYIDLSLEYLLLAFQAAQKNGESSIIISQAEKVGDLYTQIGSYHQAIDYYNIALTYAKREGNPKHFCSIYRLLGNAYYYMGEYDKSLESHMESLHFAQENRDEGGIAAAYNNIGLINTQLKKYDTALEYYQNAEKVFGKMENLTNQGMAIINIGNIFYFKDELDNALVYYQKAYNIFEKTNEAKDVALAAQNISVIYTLKKDEDNAIYFAEKALSLYLKASNAWGIIHLAQNLGYIYFEKEDLAKTEYYFNLSLEYAEQTNTLPLLITTYNSLQQLYENKGEYEKAFKYLKQQYILNDSIHKKETTERLSELESKYQVNQKEKENQLLKKYFTYISLLSLLIVAILLFNYRLKVLSNRKLREKNLQIEKQNNELAEINLTKNKFFSIIAHDLKNPLAAFIGLMEVFQLKLPIMTREEQQGLLKQISLLAESTFDLLENLLKWSRSQVGTLEFKPEKNSLNKIVDDAIKVLSWNAQLKEISIENKLVSEISIIADENMIATIIRNLLSNAVKFTNNGGKITIYSSTTENEISIFVKDNGIGISQSDQEKIFKIDSKLRNPGTANEPGTGLGLILCKDFVEKHGGKMFFDSTLDEGSTFGFTLMR